MCDSADMLSNLAGAALKSVLDPESTQQARTYLM